MRSGMERLRSSLIAQPLSTRALSSAMIRHLSWRTFAAAWVRVLSIPTRAQRLNERFKILTGGSRTALPRQKTLSALIDWSYDLLTQQEQLLFARLGVFAGGFGLDAATNICGG